MVQVRKIVLSLLALAIVFSTLAQTKGKADSLRHELSLCSSDTMCLRLHLETCDYLLFSEPGGAEHVCQEALRLSTEANDTAAIAKSLNYNGILSTIQARYITGIERFQQALTYYEALNDRIGITKLFNNIGVIYGSLENFEEAIKYYTKSLELNIELEDHEGAAFNLHNISSNYLQLKEYTKARLFADSLANYQAIHGEFLAPYRLFGEWYLQQEILDSAEYYLMRSVEHMNEIDEEHQLAGAYLSLAEVHRKRTNFDRAMLFVDRAERSAVKNQLLDAIVSVYDSKSKIYADQGRYDQAYEAQSIYIAKKDSLDEVNNFNQISELNARFETERREKEIAEKEALLIQREASERLQVRVFTLVTAFIVIVLILVSYSLVRKRRMNRILNNRNNEINLQRQKIISSINYAKKIQNAILLPEEQIKKFLPESFIYFNPKDIVSGDFYWFAQIDNLTYIASIDCTGHGVPGAFMSLIANSKLNKVVLEMGLRDPGEILNMVHKEIIMSLNQNNETSDTQDGMDMTLCVIGQKGEAIRYAGANNPIILVDGSTTDEFKVDNLSIGGTFFRDAIAGSIGFTTREIEYHSGATLFLFTDGYIDQFGGEDGKKLNKAKFRELLISIAENPLESAKDKLEESFNAWRGTNPQIDDVLIIGTKLS